MKNFFETLQIAMLHRYMKHLSKNPDYMSNIEMETKISYSSVTKITKMLAKMGYVETKKGEKHKLIVSLTDDGQSLFNILDEAIKRSRVRK